MKDLADLDRRAASLIREYQDEGEWAAFVRPTPSGRDVSIICPRVNLATAGSYLIMAGEALFNGPQG
jgi:hypothetical protein